MRRKCSRVVGSRAISRLPCDLPHSKPVRTPYFATSESKNRRHFARRPRYSPEHPALRSGGPFDPPLLLLIPSNPPSQLISRERAFVPVPPTFFCARSRPRVTRVTDDAEAPLDVAASPFDRRCTSCRAVTSRPIPPSRSGRPSTSRKVTRTGASRGGRRSAAPGPP